MPKPNPPLLKYNKTNLKRVSRAIVQNLTPDLLPKKYRAENAKNPMYGHCHTASGCLYKIFGSQSLYMCRAIDRFGIWHWWVQDREGCVIDLTASQYPQKIVEKLHVNGKKAYLLGFSYKKNVMILVDRVTRDLQL